MFKKSCSHWIAQRVVEINKNGRCLSDVFSKRLQRISDAVCRSIMAGEEFGDHHSFKDTRSDIWLSYRLDESSDYARIFAESFDMSIYELNGCYFPLARRTHRFLRR